MAHDGEGGGAAGARDLSWLEAVRREPGEGGAAGARDLVLTLRLRLPGAAGGFHGRGEAVYNDDATPREAALALRIIDLVGRALLEDQEREMDRHAGREPRAWGWTTGGR